MFFRILAILTLLLTQFNFGLAHEANAAFFEVHQSEHGFIVKAAFPWTLRNGLMQFNPDLAQAKDKSEFEAAFFAYMRENLILEDEEGKSLILTEINEMPPSGHSHQSTYDLYYEGRTLRAIQNTSQCSLYPDQKNYHEVIYRGATYEFITTPAAARFQISTQAVKKQAGGEILQGVGILCALVLFLLLINKRLLSMKNKALFTICCLLLTYNYSNAQIDCGCTSDQILDNSRGPCNETLSFPSIFNMNISNGVRTISANSIPEHNVGLFGMVMGSLNPNAIAEQSVSYEINAEPTTSAILTPLLSTTGFGPNAGPQYSFGVLLNGVELDPVAAEPFPHQGMMNPNVNWEWNLEALNVRIGLDCNNAHVQPTGKYHYHGSPTLYLENANIPTNAMTLIGYAADGFPVYYKYAYTDAMDGGSAVVEMVSSYQLKEGCRPGDGVTAPCDEYNGVYSNDYEYINGLGTLDEANGRTGVTPEYPEGTYYYMMTDAFPSIPRYFRGTPSTDFTIGPPVSGPCAGIDGGDDDNDGICKIDDCNDFDSSVGMGQTPGTSCDDGDATTENDVIQADGCSCLGEEISTSVQNVIHSSINIYPNPVSSVLTIATEGTIEYELSVYTRSGQLLHRQQNQSTIAVQNYNSGMYLLEIIDLSSGQRMVKKIVVSK